MPRKVHPSGESGHFEMCPNGKWRMVQVHGRDIWVPAKARYIRYSPRQVAISLAMEQLWIINRGNQFPWRQTVWNLRYYIHKVGTITQADYAKGKEQIRELGPEYMDENGVNFVYASTRGSHAVSGFIDEQVLAEKYEAKSHTMLAVMEGRIASGTVEPAAKQFGVPVKTKHMKTKTLK